MVYTSIVIYDFMPLQLSFRGMNSSLAPKTKQGNVGLGYE